MPKNKTLPETYMLKPLNFLFLFSARRRKCKVEVLSPSDDVYYHWLIVIGAAVFYNWTLLVVRLGNITVPIQRYLSQF